MRMPTQIFAECMDDQNHAHLAFGTSRVECAGKFSDYLGRPDRAGPAAYDYCENNSVGAWGRSTHTVGEAPDRRSHGGLVHRKARPSFDDNSDKSCGIYRRMAASVPCHSHRHRSGQSPWLNRHIPKTFQRHDQPPHAKSHVFAQTSAYNWI